MTLRQTIQAAPQKTSELIDRLSTTSNSAIKSRETLFAELSEQLNLYLQLEEQHLLPLFRKNPDTRALAAETLNGNKELRSLLVELEKAPKNDDGFLAQVAELKKRFQQHVRDERRELLPAVLKALSEDEAAELAEAFEGGFADAEVAKREARQEETRKAKHEAELVERIAETEREASRVQKAAVRDAAEMTSKVAETMKRGADTVQEGIHQVTANLAKKAEEAVSVAGAAMGAYQDSMQSTVQDLGTFAASSSASAVAISDAGAVVMDWASKSARTSVEASQQLLSCRTAAELAERQKAFATNVMRNWMEASTQIFEIAHRASKQALRPLEARLSAKR